MSAVNGIIEFDFLTCSVVQSEKIGRALSTYVAVESMGSNVLSNLKNKRFVFSIKIYANVVPASQTADNIDPIKAANFCIRSTC